MTNSSFKVLYVGNIANNAYLNAKALRQHGVHVDVLCHDYYHVMGCPEWEECELDSKSWKDDFFPDWANAKINFEHPEWFVQGPSGLCYSYLDAKNSGDKKKAKYIWLLLKAFRFAYGKPALRKAMYLARSLLTMIKYFVKGIVHKILYCIWMIIRLLKAITSFCKQTIKCFLNKDNNKYSYQENWSRLSVTLKSFLPFWRLNAESTKKENESLSEKKLLNNSLYKRIKKEYDEVFPQRKDKVLPKDIRPYIDSLDKWKNLFNQYDAVQLYATNPIMGLLIDYKPYFAFEHGTIRNIPFEETGTGRLTALSYYRAHHVFITNCDNRLAADKLQIPSDSFLPHPINEDFLIVDDRVQKIRKSLRSELDSDFIVFHPARQHWGPERHPDWEKGNDYLIKGLAKLIHTENPKASGIFVEWGQSLQKSKDLIEELGISDRIKWIPPLPNREFCRYINACDAVADQFYLGAFGSLTPKTLACGKPNLLYLNEDIHKWCFEELPPVLNCRDEDDIYNSLKRLNTDKEYYQHICEQSVRWYYEYHSMDIIAEEMKSRYVMAISQYAS